MSTFLHDLRYGLRTLARNPGFALVAVLTLALGIGANTTIFSVVDRVLLRPLPVADPERLVVIWENDRLRGTRQERASVPDFVDLRAQAKSFDGLAAWQNEDRTLTGQGEPERLVVARVSTNYFALLGVQPLAGRPFASDEEQLGREKVAILGEGLWRRRFGGDRSVIGKSILLDGESFVVAGVMPAEARIPNNPEDLWVPMAFAPLDMFRGRHNARIYGRMKPGVSLDQAQTEASTVMSRLEAAYPNDNMGRGALVVRLHDQLVGSVRPALFVLLGAVGLVLLIACANVANLLLARASARRKEIAVRAALGAGRGRLVRQLLTENVTLALLGAGAGTLLASWGVSFLRVSGPAGIPRLTQAGLDGKIFAFTLGVSLLAWFVFSVAPVFHGSRADSIESLRVSGSPLARGSASRYLVVSEVALSVILLISAGLLLRSFWMLLKVDPGYDPRNVVTLSIQLPPALYPAPKGWPILQWPQVSSFHSQLLEKVRGLPGVESAALALYTPASGGWTTRVTIAGRPTPPPGQQDEAHYRPVNEDYFHTARLPIRRGRAFSAQDDERHVQAAIINESFAARYFPGEDPIGRHIVVYGAAREIVGVVASERFLGLGRESPPAMYLPLRQNPQGSMSLIVRTGTDPMRLVPAVQAEIWSIDRSLAAYDVISLERALEGSLAERRFTMLLLGTFAVMAQLLASVGIYGVVHYSVSRRTQEIGIRMVLGAMPGEVLRLIVGQGFRLSLAGAAIGAGGALALSRFLETQLFGVSRTDPVTFIVVPVVSVLVTLAASYMPARRAMRVEPMLALRYE